MYDPDISMMKFHLDDLERQILSRIRDHRPSATVAGTLLRAISTVASIIARKPFAARALRRLPPAG